MLFLTTVFTLVFRVLVQNVGPVTTYTDYPSMQECQTARIDRMMAARERMIHGHCEERTVNK
jgi:low affinity Fe/Cu permease